MKMRPSRLLLRTAGECDFDPEHLLEVFGGQRRRFVAVLEGFGPDDWAASTRCAAWSAHDVVRHLCDGNVIGAGTDDRSIDVAGGFDPRITPCQWLTASAEESPEDTLTRFAATTEEVFGILRARLVEGRTFDVTLPYGPMDWTVFVLHGFWDSWLHERDVLLARGVAHRSSDDADFYATAYGVFIAAVVASIFGEPVQETLELSGDGGGVFHVDSSGGATALTATRVATGGPRAAEVTDALAGRSPVVTALCHLPSNSRAALSCLADFFNTPIEQSPT
jgi:uncharacterized protein (TIGR03083 family)